MLEIKNNMLPKLSLETWKDTRNAIQAFSKVMSKIREVHTPKSKHWFHLSLKVTSRGITTTPIPIKNDLMSFEIIIDLTKCMCVLEIGNGQTHYFKLEHLSQLKFYSRIKELLALSEIKIHIDPSSFDEHKQTLNQAYLGTFKEVLLFTDNVLKRFKYQLNEETGPVQLWPDHFDLALLWFSGIKIEGKDPNDLENAMEQMNFGFSTGDSIIKDAYYYITRYPINENLTSLNLTKNAFIHTKEFTAVILPYDSLTLSKNPSDDLFSFLKHTFNQMKTY